MRRDIQEIFTMTPHEKQVMMFSASLSRAIHPVCKKFMNNVITPSACHLILLNLMLMHGEPCRGVHTSLGSVNSVKL